MLHISPGVDGSLLLRKLANTCDNWIAVVYKVAEALEVGTGV